MGLFRKRKSRATRRAEARAIKSRAKLEAKLSAKNEARRIKERTTGREQGPQGTPESPAGQRPGRTEGRRDQPQVDPRRKVVVADTDSPGADGISAACPGIDSGHIPGGRRCPRTHRSASRRSTRNSVGPDRPVLRARRAIVGADRGGGAVAADGAGAQAQRRRDQAVRVGRLRASYRSGGSSHDRGEHARCAAPGGPHRDLVATRRNRGRPDGPARAGLTAGDHTPQVGPPQMDFTPPLGNPGSRGVVCRLGRGHRAGLGARPCQQ